MDEQELDINAGKIADILENNTIVYFLRCNKDYVKIGVSHGHIMRRIADLQVGNPYKLELEWFMIGDNKLEMKIHKLLLKYCVRGEWHKINKKDMLNLLKEL